MQVEKPSVQENEDEDVARERQRVYRSEYSEDTAVVIEDLTKIYKGQDR